MHTSSRKEEKLKREECPSLLMRRDDKLKREESPAS